MANRALVLGAVEMVLALGSWVGPTVADARAAPALDVDPRSGVVGTTVSIAGRGFCGSPGCSSVQISFGGIVVADGVGVAPDGSFARTLTVPGGAPPGERAVSATQTNASGQRRMAITTFQVTVGGTGATAPPTATATATDTATPPGTEPPTMPTSSAPPVIVSVASGENGSTTGLTLAMVVAAAVFVTSLLGMGYVLVRSRERPEPSPPPWGTMAPPEPGPRPPEPSPKSPQPPVDPSQGSGDGQTTG